MVKAVVFDLDDTLISEKEYIISGYNHISKLISDKFGINKKQIFTDLIKLFEQSSYNVFNRLYEKYRIEYSNEMIQDLVNEYRGHFPNIQFYDDVIPYLNELKKLEIKTGIVTDGYAVAQRQKLLAVDAEKYFNEIIVTDELGIKYWKPHPKAFELIREKLEVDFNEMIYVGDNPEKDFYIGSIYPIKTVRIKREGFYNSRNYLENVIEMYSINRLDEISKLIHE